MRCFHGLESLHVDPARTTEEGASEKEVFVEVLCLKEGRD